MMLGYFRLAISVLLLFGWASNSSASDIGSLAKLNASNEIGAIDLFVLRSQSKLKAELERITWDNWHLEALKPRSKSDQISIYQNYYSILNTVNGYPASLKYNADEDKIQIDISVLFYGASQKELNVAISQWIAGARFVLGIQEDDGVFASNFPSKREQAFLLHKRVFPNGPANRCKEFYRDCIKNASEEVIKIGKQLLSRIELRLWISVPPGEAFSRWGRDNFQNDQWDCSAERPRNLFEIKHTMINGFSSSASSDEVETGIKIPYRLDSFDEVAWGGISPSQYFIGATLCRERGRDLRIDAIKRAQKNSLAMKRYMFRELE